MTAESTISLPHCEAVSRALLELLSTACGISADPSEEHGEEICKDGVIISVISVMGDVEWSIFLGLPKMTATSIAEKFAGFAIPFDSEDMGDAIGEVANILAGCVKNILDKQGVRVEISLPSVFRADGLHILKKRDSQSMRSCFTSVIGPLWTGVIAGNSTGIMA